MPAPGACSGRTTERKTGESENTAKPAGNAAHLDEPVACGGTGRSLSQMLKVLLREDDNRGLREQHAGKEPKHDTLD